MLVIPIVVTTVGFMGVLGCMIAARMLDLKEENENIRSRLEVAMCTMDFLLQERAEIAANTRVNEELAVWSKNQLNA